MIFDLIVPFKTRIAMLKNYGADRADIPIGRSSKNTPAPIIHEENK